MADLCRVTVVAGERRLDVGLPGDVPLAELLAPLAARIGLPDRGSAGWALRRMTGPALDAGLSAEDLGVRHGEVLHLRPLSDSGPVLWVDDVVDAVSTAAAELPGRWTAASGRAVGAVVLAAALAGGAAAVLSAGGRPAPALVAGAGALVLLIAAALVDRALNQGALATLLGVASAGYAFVAAALATGVSGIGVWAVAAAAALVVCAVGAIVAPAAGPGLIAASTVAVMALVGVGAAAVLPATAAGAAAAALALALMLAPLFPMAAFRLSPLPMPFLPSGRAELAGGGHEVSHDDVAAGLMRADRLLSGLVAGSAVTAIGAGVLVLTKPGWAAFALLGVGGLAALLRARHHRGLAQRLWLYGSGLALLGLGIGDVVIHSGQLIRLGAAAGLLCVASIATSIASAGSGSRAAPRLGRLVDVIEVMAVIALLPLALDLLGVYATVRTFGG